MKSSQMMIDKSCRHCTQLHRSNNDWVAMTKAGDEPLTVGRQSHARRKDRSTTTTYTTTTTTTTNTILTMPVNVTIATNSRDRPHSVYCSPSMSTHHHHVAVHLQNFNHNVPAESPPHWIGASCVESMVTETAKTTVNCGGTCSRSHHNRKQTSANQKISALLSFRQFADRIGCVTAADGVTPASENADEKGEVQQDCRCCPGVGKSSKVDSSSKKLKLKRSRLRLASLTTSSAVSTRTLRSAAYCTPLVLIVALVLGLQLIASMRGVSAATNDISLLRHIREASNAVSSNNTSNPQRTDENGICGSKDIRNEANQLETLRGCRVIEGFLVITLIEKDASEFENRTFPELEEITDFFVMYRLRGIRSLAKLFPNLRVIRGNTLVTDYALIVFEIFELQDIGLHNLRYIGRGFVRIEKNAELCFSDSIDWTAIAPHTSLKDHFLQGNRAANGCPLCPSGKQFEGSPKELDCPVSPYDQKKRLCWNRQMCQKICPSSCGNRTCNDKNECCDESCIGSCYHDDESNKEKCYVCRNLALGPFINRECTNECPNNLFRHYDRRCVTAEECRNVTRPFSSNPNDTFKFPYIPFNGVCSVSCPTGYDVMGLSRTRHCVKCDGQCKKTCVAATIDSIASAQQFRGCTAIKGSLLIQIRSQGGHNVVKELETALSDVEEIEGSLKIVRSFPIVSLSFFRSLKKIRGTRPSEDRSSITSSSSTTTWYSLYVMDNQNLQDLFPHNVTIEHGKIFFHFNPKLCYSNIEKLKSNVIDLIGVDHLAIEDVATNSNGDKVACNVTLLKVIVTDIASVAAILSCEAMQYPDERVLLGYVLHYIPAPFQNVTLYDGRDACGGDGWKVEDIMDFDRSADQFSVLMSRLEPYTQYAYYIKTYTIASEPYGGQTPIQYLTTDPDKPESVRRLSALSNGSSEIIIEWDPPKKAKGNLTTYIIKAYLSSDNAALVDQRNYCTEPLGPVDDKVPPLGTVPQPTEVKPSPRPQQPMMCNCDEDESRERPKLQPAEAEQLIEFENALQNIIYVRRIPIKGAGTNDATRRRRRATDGTMISGNSSMATTTTTGIYMEEDVEFPSAEKPTPLQIDVTESKKVDEYYEYIYQAVNVSVTKVVLRELKHYSSYSISVRACREGKAENCSNDIFVQQRTARIESADNIPYVMVSKVSSANHTRGMVRISWPPPPRPNGLIVSYTIRYQRVDLEHSKGQDICITHHMYKNQGAEYVMSHMDNGNYSFVVMATSLAGPGAWSAPQYITVDVSSISNWQIFFIVLGIVLVLILIGVVLWFLYQRKYGAQVSDLKLIASVNPEYVSMQYKPDEWEVPRDKIVQLRELGQGSFGMVYEGVVKDLRNKPPEVRCAIKTVNDNATDRERINFLKEAGVMKAFDTHHVVRLLGVVSNGQPTLVIMELMANGDLKGYLRSHRPEAEAAQQPPSLKRILQMSIEIADGMAYLAAKKFVHRDLAARNCMVADDLTVKIGDFGMTRDIYETDYYRKGTKGLLPVRWMAPESLKDGIFSTSSDVFSFGVVLWEMATLASQPYQGLSNDQVLKYVIDGGVMERPENCPDKLYKMMCRTWQHRPSSRPTFMQIVTMLLDDAVPAFRQFSFYHSPEGQDLLQQKQHQVLEVDASTPLRAEEEDFSIDGGYLMNKSSIEEEEEEENATALPLSSSGIGLRRITSSIPDIALKNRSSPMAAPTNLQHNQQQYPEPGTSRNQGGSINRGIEFLRNAFFGYGGGGVGSTSVGTSPNGRNGSNGNSSDSKDYRRLQSRSYQPPTELHSGRMFDFFLAAKKEGPSGGGGSSGGGGPSSNHVPASLTPIEYDFSGDDTMNIKQQSSLQLPLRPPPLRNGFVVQSLPPKDSQFGTPSPAHHYTTTPSASHHQSTTINASLTPTPPTTPQISTTTAPADHQHPAGPQTQEFELKSC